MGRPFWHSFHASLHALYPNLTSVGEVYNSDPVVTSAYAEGVTRNDLNGSVDTGLTTPFDFPTYFAIRDVLLHGKSMSRMADILRQDSLYPHPERLVPFLGNHDTKRFLGENNATPDKLKLAFAMLLTMRGLPQIYSGDEIAMAGGEDPENRRDFPGGFAEDHPGSAQGAFNPVQQTPAQRDMYDWVRQLLQLRAHNPELNGGGEQMLYADDDLLLYVRGDGLGQGCDAAHGRVLVVVNRAQQVKALTLPTANTALAGCEHSDAMLGQLSATTGADRQQQLSIPPGASLARWH